MCSKGTSLHEKLFNKSFKGASEIGLIMACFFLLLFIVFPLSLLIQEFSLYKNQMRSVQTQTEMTCYDVMTRFDFNALSEGNLVAIDFEQLFKTEFEKDLKHFMSIENLVIKLNHTEPHTYLDIKFSYPYLTEVVFKSHIEKQVVVSLKVVLPLNE